MSYELVTYRIEQIADVIGGGTPSTKREDFYGGDIPWITPKDLSGYSDVFISNGARNITELGLKSSSARTLPKNSILFTSRAPIGYVAIAEKEVSTNQGFKSLIPKSNLLDYKFAYYMMKYYAPRIEAIASGSTFKEVSGSVVKNFEVTIPKCLKAQREIAETLFSLDEGIQNNTRMNQILEKIAQRIFKSWFIDFDPVKANAEGVPFSDLSPDIQSLFPSELVESEMGLIPKGWEVKQIGDEVTCVGGATPSTSNTDFWEGGELLWTTPKDLSGQESKILFDTARKITDKGLKKISSGLLPVNTVLMSSRAPVGYLALAREEVAINQGYIAMKCENTIGPLYLLNWLERNMNTIKQSAGGTTFSEISKKSFRPIPMLVADRAVANAFEDTVSSFYEKIEANVRQNASLRLIRDRLLPKLLSGSIEIKQENKAA